MRVLVHAEVWEASKRLKELGLTIEQLIDVVKASVAGRGNCTDNDPPAAPGWSSWQMGTRRLREIYRKQGWEKDDTNQFSTIINHGRRIKISFCNTDDGTAIQNRIPRNRSRKGVIAERVTDVNKSGYLFPEMESEDALKNTADYETWYLCVYAEDEFVRAELSRPSEFDSGYFTAYSERIFILRPDEWKELDFANKDDDLIEDLEINVRRK